MESRLDEGIILLLTVTVLQILILPGASASSSNQPIPIFAFGDMDTSLPEGREGLHKLWMMPSPSLSQLFPGDILLVPMVPFHFLQTPTETSTRMSSSQFKNSFLDLWTIEDNRNNKN